MDLNRFNRTRSLTPSWLSMDTDEITFDHFVFVKRITDGEFIILLLYVDDTLIVG